MLDEEKGLAVKSQSDQAEGEQASASSVFQKPSKTQIKRALRKIVYQKISKAKVSRQTLSDFFKPMAQILFLKKKDVELACKKVEELQLWMEGKEDPQKDHKVDAQEGVALSNEVDDAMFKQRRVFCANRKTCDSKSRPNVPHVADGIECIA